MKIMPRIKVEAGESFVYEITHKGKTIAEIICVGEQIEYNFETGKSKVKMNVTLPPSINSTSYII